MELGGNLLKTGQMPKVMLPAEFAMDAKCAYHQFFCNSIPLHIDFYVNNMNLSTWVTEPEVTYVHKNEFQQTPKDVDDI